MKRYIVIGVIFLLNFFYSLSAGAAIKLTAPDSVAKGNAFLARAITDQAVNNIVFFWNGRTFSIQTQKINDINGDKYEAQILLPVSLDEKSKKLVLSAGSGDRKAGRPLSEVNMDIKIYERKRPVQKLTVDKKYVELSESQKQQIQLDRKKITEVLSKHLPVRYWELPLYAPVPGSVSSQFGMKRVFNGQPRSVHKGVDLRGATGTPIKACADGVVVLVDDLYYSGKCVYVNHGDGVFTAYLHMSEPIAKPGQHIKKGDVLGLVGATGRVTGPHLHLSLIVQGQSVDPLPLIEKSN